MDIKGGRNFDEKPTVGGDAVVVVTDSVGVHVDVDLTGIAVDDFLKWDGSKLIKTAPPTSVFGQNFQQTSLDAQSPGTTSSAWTNRLNLSPSGLPSGTYRIGWSVEAMNTSSAGEAEIRVQIDNLTTIAEGGVEGTIDGCSDPWHSFAGFYYWTDSGPLSIDLDYSNECSGTSYIRKARLEFWRVS